MLVPVRSVQFRRDAKLAERRGKNMDRLREAILLLLEEKELPARLKDHALAGNWKGYRDLHIEPDWLLLYRIEADELQLARTGTHSDLFGK